MINVKKFCSKNNIKYKENYDFGKKHGYKVSGLVTSYIETDNIEKLCNFLYFAKNNKLKVIGIGGGSNVLIDNKINAILVKYNSKKIHFTNTSNKLSILSVDAGLSKKNLINFCIDNNLANLEFLSGIPGTISGGLAMNAGAYNNELADFVLDIDFATPDGIKKYTKRELNWTYRNLNVLPYHIITNACFITDCIEDKSIISSKCKKYISDRNRKHPIYFNSCGSVFKNPEGNFAWKLIKEITLNVKSYNGAKLSLLHSNFIINNGSKKTSATDIISLIRDIKKTVYNKFNVNLEEEIKILS